MGDVMSDLQGRRALIMGMDSEAGYQKLQAKIPLKELANYSISLSSLTGGRASFTTKFASYELVPTDIQTRLIAEHECYIRKTNCSKSNKYNTLPAGQSPAGIFFMTAPRFPESLAG